MGTLDNQSVFSLSHLFFFFYIEISLIQTNNISD